MLYPGVQRCEYPQALTLQILQPVIALQLTASQFQKRRVFPLSGTISIGRLHRLSLRADALGSRNDVVLGHQAQHQVAALFSPLRMPARIVIRRSFHQPHQHGYFTHLQFTQRLAEVKPRCQPETMNGAPPGLPQIHLVQIGLQNLILAVMQLQQHGHHGFLRFAQQGAVVTQE